MKKQRILFLVVVMGLQVTQLHAMANHWQRGTMAVQKRMQKARLAVSQSRPLQAVVKFVQRKPLSDEEKAFLKKVSFTAAVAAIVAAATGLTVAAVKRRMAENERFAEQKKPFDPEAAHRALVLKAAKDKGIDVNPNPLMGDREFILAVIDEADHRLETFYCRAKDGQNSVSQEAAQFALTLAKGSKYRLGILVIEYILEQFGEAGYNWGGKVESSRGRQLEQLIVREFDPRCQN